MDGFNVQTRKNLPHHNSFTESLWLLVMFFPLFTLIAVTLVPISTGKSQYVTVLPRNPIRWDRSAILTGAVEDLNLKIDSDNVEIVDVDTIQEIAPHTTDVVWTPRAQVVLQPMVIAANEDSSSGWWMDAPQEKLAVSVEKSQPTKALVVAARPSPKNSVLIGTQNGLLPLSEVEASFKKDMDEIGKGLSLADNTPSSSTPEEGRGKKDSLQVSGNIEISGGLHFTGIDNELKIFWDSGMGKKFGLVDIEEGTYRLAVDDWKGQIIGELRMKNGRVVGQGVVHLQGEERDELNIKITPIGSVLSGQIVSWAGPKSSLRPLAKANIYVSGVGENSSDENGEFFVDHANMDSSFIVAAKNAGHYPSIRYQRGLSPLSLPLIRNEVLQQWLQATPFAGATLSDTTFVYGQVRYDQDFPVAGAEVEVSGDFPHVIIYFDENGQAQAKQKQTSSNGYYLIAMSQKGIHSIRAKWEGQTSANEVIELQQGLALQINLLVGLKKEIDIQVRELGDAQHLLQAKASTLSNDKEVVLDGGNGQLTLKQSDGLQIVELETEDREWEPMRINLSGMEEAITVDTVKRSEILEWAAQKKISRDPNRGNVLVKYDLGQQIRIDEYTGGDVVCISSEKKVLESCTDGSGWMLFYNVKEGLQTILKTNSDQSTVVQMALVTSDRLAVIE